MLEDYKKAVISNYHYKKEKGLLSSNLSDPTPAKLRKESLIALRTRTKKEDEKIIRDFFNGGVESNDYTQAINRFDRDKFKPLDNFIAGETEVRDYNNVELLAWLINFEPRPRKFGVDYSTDKKPNEELKLIDNSKEKENLEIPEDVPPKQDEPLPQKDADNKKNRKSILKKNIVLITIPILLSSGIYLYADWTKAYICDRGTGKKYHLSDKCPALKKCNNGFISTTIAEAEKNGKSLCDWEK